jgi:hypothetical protein
MTARVGSAGAAVALSFALLLLHAAAELAGLPGLVALDLADRVGSVAGIAALTVVLEQALRRHRYRLVPAALAGQATLLVLPSLLHADAVGATYDARTLLAGLAAQALLTLAVVAAALRVEDAVEALLADRPALPAATRLRPTGTVTGHPLVRRAARPPGRAPPSLAPA